MLALVGSEVAFRTMRKQEDSFEIDASKYPVISAAEFEKRVENGTKLFILDNFVLDLTSYIHQHPGGAFLLDQTIGRDISKFFYGGYTLDGNTMVKPGSTNPALHVHSNVARKIVLKHIVAVIWSNEIDCANFKIDHTQTNDVNSFTKSFVLKVCDESKSHNLRDYFSDPATLGQHFTVVGLDSSGKMLQEKSRSVRRHYTIANAMKQPVYTNLVNSLKNSASVNKELLTDDISDQVSITIKTYKLDKGVARLFFNQEKDGCEFTIKGPMGRGLGLTKKSKGTHFAFAAGTGVLVYIDLVARLALQELGAIPESQKLDKDFRLVLFASFQKREDAIGLELLEALVDRVNSSGSVKFELNLRFSNQKSARWDKNFVSKQMEASKDNLERIWVCGPPLMNESFEKILEELCETYKINFRTQVDLM